jgi:hypothetical protein
MVSKAATCLILQGPVTGQDRISAIERFANDGEMITEQLWDADDLPNGEMSLSDFFAQELSVDRRSRRTVPLCSGG